MPRKTDKRVRLVEAAKSLIHRQGFNLTTLADIAQEADVPLGNVYYYFKTKEAIGAAVIESRAREVNERLQSWNNEQTPRARLSKLLAHEVNEAENTVKCGCPIGGLCQELAKQGGALSESAAKLLSDIVSWVEKQFKELGHTDDFNNLALEFIATIQGTALLTNTYRDTRLTSKMCVLIEKWLDTKSHTVVEHEIA